MYSASAACIVACCVAPLLYWAPGGIGTPFLESIRKITLSSPSFVRGRRNTVDLPPCLMRKVSYMDVSDNDDSQDSPWLPAESHTRSAWCLINAVYDCSQLWLHLAAAPAAAAAGPMP
jgi:hypothetical protein